MKDFLSKIQKDLKHLQSTIEKEGNDLVSKAKKAVNDIGLSKNVASKTKELEKLIEAKFNKFEPAIYKFIGQVSKNAKKYGLDVGDLEKIVRTSVKKAKSSLHKTATTAKAQKKSIKKKIRKVVKPKSTQKSDTGATGA
jgi:hypothetical protein